MKKWIAIACLAWSTIAHAEFFDGNSLLAKMNSASLADEMVALGYVMGVADAHREVTYCKSPETVTSGQMRDIVKIYLERYPQTRHYTADVLVGRALGIVWPCAKREPAPGSRAL